MKEILETIILNLVDDKNAVHIEEKVNDNSIVYEVKVSKEDMGKVIGKQGRIANSIRTVMKSVGSKDHKKISIDFVE